MAYQQPSLVIKCQIQYISKSKVGDPKAPFSSATTPRFMGGCNSFLQIAPLYPRYVPYNAVLSKVASSTIFWGFGMTRPGIEPWSPRPWTNTTHKANGLENIHILFVTTFCRFFFFLIWSFILQTVKWFQVFLTQIILLTINHLFEQS